MSTLLKTVNSGSPAENSPNSIRPLRGEVLDRPLSSVSHTSRIRMIHIDYTASASISCYIHSAQVMICSATSPAPKMSANVLLLET